MEEDKLWIDILRKETERKADRRMRTPMDFDFLSLKIKEMIGDTVSPSTIKRLWGYVSSSHIPNESTLSVFARFIGYKEWKEFVDFQKGNVSSSFLECEQIQVGQLKEGDVLEIRFGEKMAKYRILQVAEVVRKNDAGMMYELLAGEEDL